MPYLYTQQNATTTRTPRHWQSQWHPKLAPLVISARPTHGGVMRIGAERHDDTRGWGLVASG